MPSKLAARMPERKLRVHWLPIVLSASDRRAGKVSVALCQEQAKGRNQPLTGRIGFHPNETRESGVLQLSAGEFGSKAEKSGPEAEIDPFGHIAIT